MRRPNFIKFLRWFFYFIIVYTVFLNIQITILSPESNNSRHLHLKQKEANVGKRSKSLGVYSFCNESSHKESPNSRHPKYTHQHFGRYIVVRTFAEQLTKSRLHLAELMFVAKLTNRILVLPKCRRGHIGNSLHFQYPICEYFNVNKMSEYIDWVSEEVFLERMAKYQGSNGSRIPPTFRLMVKKTSDKNPAEGSIAHYRQKSKFSRKHNLTMAVVDNGHYKSVNCDQAASVIPTSPLYSVLERSANSANVLVVWKTATAPCFDFSNSIRYLTYSENLVSLMERFVSAKLGRRYLSIQWRMEKMLLKEKLRANFRTCAQGLISTSKAIISRHRVSGVFLAADFTADNVIHSSSLALLNETKRGESLSVLRDLEKALRPKTWESFDPQVLRLDQGAQGILDKLVCKKGHIFLYPPNSCYGMPANYSFPSSYTNEIINARLDQGLSVTWTHSWNVELSNT